MNKVNRILIADDDKYIRKIIMHVLKAENYKFYEAENGDSALYMVKEIEPDLIILDISMPRYDGYHVCDLIRRKPEIYGNPLILMLTAKTQQKDLEKGFETGADDYLRKPFEHRELNLRVKSLLRRADRGLLKVLKYKDILVYMDKKIVTEKDKEIELTKKEYEMLYYLILNRGNVLSKDQIMQNVWFKPYRDGDKNVEIFARQLRGKLKIIEENLVTIRGMGYKLELD